MAPTRKRRPQVSAGKISTQCDSSSEAIRKQYDVFLSYTGADEAWAKQLKARMVESGLSVWLACDDVLPGAPIPSAIEIAMTASAAVVIVVSPESLASGWVRQEYETAVTLRTRLFPVLLRTATLPPFLARLQYADFRVDANFDVALDRLVTAIRQQPLPRRRTVSHVCFVSSEYPPHVYGGLGVHVEKLTTALSQHLSVDILLPDPGMNEYRHMVPRARPIPLNISASYNDPPSWVRFAEFVTPKLERLASKERPRVIHCHDWVTVLAGIRGKWLLNIPLLFHVHLPNRNPLSGSIENLGLVCADIVTVNSEAMFVELSDRRLPIRKLRIVSNGVDLDIFRPAQNWPADGGYILFVGRLVEQKGVEYLLRAFYYVRDKFQNIRLKIVGDGEFREWLERLASNLMLSSHVEFVRWMPHDKLASLYQEALFVVVPSVFEPFGMVALEAFACKRPVVASRVGGLKEIVKHHMNGFLTEPKDHLDLAQWLLSLLSEAELRSRMGEAGFARLFEEGYTWPATALQFIEFYEELNERPLDKTPPREASAFVEQILDMAPEADVWQWRKFLRTLFH